VFYEAPPVDVGHGRHLTRYLLLLLLSLLPLLVALLPTEGLRQLQKGFQDALLSSLRFLTRLALRKVLLQPLQPLLGLPHSLAQFGWKGFTEKAFHAAEGLTDASFFRPHRLQLGRVGALPLLPLGVQLLGAAQQLGLSARQRHRFVFARPHPLAQRTLLRLQRLPKNFAELLQRFFGTPLRLARPLPFVLSQGLFGLVHLLNGVLQTVRRFGRQLGDTLHRFLQRMP
jgi:hypothetical protein